MDGHGSDLRTGLPWQMVEIHEPVRLLVIVEAETDTLARILAERPAVAQLVVNRWIQLVAWSPRSGEMQAFSDDGFVPYVPEHLDLPVVATSAAHFRGRRGPLAAARIAAGLRMGGAS
jgi:hypothetical protein